MKKMKKNLIPAIEYSIQNPQIPITKVGELFKVDRHSISKYKANNLYLEYKFKNASNKNDEYIYQFEQNELDFIDLYLNNANTSYEILKKQIPNAPERRTLYKYLKILGKEKTEGGTIKYHYDRTKFFEIKTEEDAYWLGFITADGCIVKNKWLQIQLAEIDYGHLEKFCTYMGLNASEIKEIIKNGFGGAYNKDNPICNLKICSQEIINNLQDKNIECQKSGKERPYICSSIALEKAYIRGLIDGDGYIRSTQYGMGIVGSLDICTYVKNFITNNIKDISNNTIHEHGIIFKLELSGKLQTSQILQYLYEDATIYLDRKYKIYKEYYNS